MTETQYRDSVLYSREHVWVVPDSVEKIAYIGISKHASKEMAGIVFADLGNSRRVVKRGDEMGTLESTKAVESIVCPFDCMVADVHGDISNGSLNETPERLSSWLYVVNITDVGWRKDLMTPEEYAKYTGGDDAADET